MAQTATARLINIKNKRVSTMQSDDNGSILARIAAGENGSFELLIEKYGNLVWSIGKKFLYRQSDLEDAVQEVFIAIWKSADKYDANKAKEITFVSMIARRRFIDHLRKISKHKNLESIDDDNSGHQLYKESILNESTDLQLVKNAIQSLDIDDQELLNLSVYQGYSHSEISKLLNIPLGTVKTRIRRNLIKLKEIFENNETNTILNLNNA
ncbi:MAG: RNA polymerase sigma factor [Woeseia sp.]|jgi:RNA polymerase sigma-70 factor (ECF subfamily)|nr:MAG: RNA polymerase sigma factor [Woeseia sp.]|tara:strand:+ start:423 stop:1055 length:633 start_codon:yes stop_codon:yes gene_type:complete